jgi:hypothetical protein
MAPILPARDCAVIGTYTELRHDAEGERARRYYRTEDIPLRSGWALEGTKTSHPARACGI